MKNMVFLRLFTLVLVWIASPGGLGLHTLAATQEPVFETRTHRFQEVAPGVYFVTGTGQIITYSNALVIVTSSDTIAVDSHVTGAAARALVASIRELTDRPVKFLINTHFHYDHVHGNEGFPPGVSIIGHEVTRQRLLDNPKEDPIFVNSVAESQETVKRIKENLAAATDAQERERLTAVLEKASAHLDSLVRTNPVPPDVTLERKLTIYRDGRPIEVIFLGRAHTGGDVIVYLPRERMLFTGDLLMPMPSYMGDGYIDEWIATLQKIEKLDFDLILPGHGAPFRDRTYIRAFQKVLGSLWDQLVAQRERGLAPHEAIQKVDLSEALSFYDPKVVPGHMRDLDPRIAVRVYERLDQLEAGGSDRP